MLTVINPEVMYHVMKKKRDEPARSVKGIAIRLKEFLAMLDGYSIPHDTEKNIRKWIRGSSSCNSYMKQHFLRSSSPGLTKISRSVPGTTWCKTCVCIAKEYISEMFFESISGMFIDMYYSHIIFTRIHI